MTDEEKTGLREQLKTMQQVLLEVAHAQRCGSSWYTRGENGLYQQVAMWVSRGQDALNAASKIIDTPNSVLDRITPSK